MSVFWVWYNIASSLRFWWGVGDWPPGLGYVVSWWLSLVLVCFLVVAGCLSVR